MNNAAKLARSVTSVEFCGALVLTGTIRATRTRIGEAAVAIGVNTTCVTHAAADCLDTYWAQRYLANKSMFNLWRLRRRWRKGPT